MKKYYRVLTIAGSDSGGGAGIQADLKTFSALGCFGMSVITAITAQNTVLVSGIHDIPPGFISKQMDAVMEDIGADAFKIGMLHSPDVIQAVTEKLIFYQASNIVVDPVMVAKSGDKLLQDDAIDALKSLLLPIATIITPNILEASVLLEREIRGVEQMEAACRDLAAPGSQSVLLKGGHLTGKRSTDLLYIRDDDSLIRLDEERINTVNSHGTGCTLSSAIAANLARGYTLREAVISAKKYITRALQAGAEYQLGKGHGPVHHFHAFW